METKVTANASLSYRMIGNSAVLSLISGLFARKDRSLEKEDRVMLNEPVIDYAEGMTVYLTEIV